MLYVDYTWDLKENGIVLDQEINIDRLGWKSGDCFKIVNKDGQVMLIKMDDVEQFTRGHKVNGQSS
jgi:hypothetical protein